MVEKKKRKKKNRIPRFHFTTIMENRDTFGFGLRRKNRFEIEIGAEDRGKTGGKESGNGGGGIRRGGGEGKISEEQRIVARYSPRGNGIGVIVDRSLAKPLSPLNMAEYGESRFSKTSDEGERWRFSVSPISDEIDRSGRSIADTCD